MKSNPTTADKTTSTVDKTTSTTGGDIRSTIISYGPLLALLLPAWLYLYAPVTPPDGFWGGIGALIYGPMFSMGMILLLMLAAVPAVQSRLLKLAGSLPRVTINSRALRVIIWYGLAVALMVLLRSKVLYGDGEIVMDHLRKGEWINFKEPLDRLAAALMYRGLRLMGVDSPYLAVTALSVTSGVIFLAAVRRFAARVKRQGDSAGVATVFIASAGFAALFFGHVENYSLLAAGVTWFMILALESINDRSRRPYSALLVLSLTFCAHLSAVWMFPGALGLLLIRKHRFGARVSFWMELGGAFLISLIPLAATAGLVLLLRGHLQLFTLANFGGGDRSLFVPLVKSSIFHKYTLMSTEHMRTVLNELLLTGAAQLSALLVFLPLSFLRRSSSPRVFDGEVLFAALCFLGSLAYVTLFNPDMWIANRVFGVLNEWDLFSQVGVPQAFLSYFITVRTIRRARRPEGIISPVLILSILHLSGFVLFNARIFG